MPSFYEIVPPPGNKDQGRSGNVGYLIREDHERNHAGGRWLTVACAILCLSIVVALFGTLGDRPVSTLKSFIPVTLGRAAAVSPAQESRAPVPFPTATNPLRWADLTLMLRTGLSDDEIITDIAAKQLVVPIGSAQEAELRELGAGERLLSALRSRRLYATPATEMPVSTTQIANAAPVVPVVARPITASQLPAPSYAAPPVDYAARDRQIASLQARIDDLDERIRRIRTNPDRYWYNRDYGVDRQQGMDRYLSQLDKERNELRRQKWQLEGR